MRNLQTRDMFNAVRLIKNLNLKEDIRGIILNAANKEDSSEDKNDNMNIGVDLLFVILDKACEKNTEEKVYEFLAGPFECTSEQVASLDPIDLFENLKNVANIERWKTFLSKAVQLMK